MKHPPRSAAPSATAEAATIALNFLAFLAAEPERLGRFLSLTGLDPGGLRAAIDSPVLHAGLLEYALSDESLLLAFAADQGLAPDAVAHARRRLPGAAD